jgi:hypothetical protein
VSPAWFLFSINCDNSKNFIGNPVALREGIKEKINSLTEGITRFRFASGYVHTPLDMSVLPFPLLRFPSWFVLHHLASPLPRLL